MTRMMSISGFGRRGVGKRRRTGNPKVGLAVMMVSGHVLDEKRLQSTKDGPEGMGLLGLPSVGAIAHDVSPLAQRSE